MSGPLLGRDPRLILGPLEIVGAWSWISIVSYPLVAGLAFAVVMALTHEGDRGGRAARVLLGLALQWAIVLALTLTAIGAAGQWLLNTVFGWGAGGVILAAVLALAFGFYGNYGPAPLSLFFAYHDPRVLWFILLPSQTAGLLRLTAPLWLPLLLRRRRSSGSRS